MLSRLLSSLTAFIHLTSALPTSTNTHTTKRQDDTNNTIAEYWTVPRMDLHMMSIHTGLPGDQWPPGSTFDSTIDFDILLPNHTLALESNNTTTIDPPTTSLIKINCKASFSNGTLPLGPIPCTSPSPTETLFFEIYPYTKLGPRRAELAFWLDLTSAIGFNEEEKSADMFWWGRRPITANDPKEESSFLTCLEGIPMDGLRCKIKSYMSVHEELVVGVEKFSGEEDDEVEEDGGK